MENNPSYRPVRIFISYSHKDSAHKDKLEKQLTRFMAGRGEIWQDLLINAGDIWKEEIWIALHQSDLVLFLMSADAIDSGFIFEVELKKTYKRHEKGEVVFIPIFLRDCKWQEINDLARFQVIPRDNKPMIHNTLWASEDEPFKIVADEIIRTVKTIWYRINNEMIEQNRPKRFAGIFQFLIDNPNFFDMGKIVKASPPNQPEDVLYFIGVANHLKEFGETIRLADANGVNWIEETFKNVDFFYDICEQMETVWQCSDHVWKKVEPVHTRAKARVELLEENVSQYIGVDWSKMDYYKSKYALPLSFILEEYEGVLRELAEESLNAQ